MRAIQITAPREITLLDNAPRPEPKSGEVLVRCSHVAICGSNMGQYTGEGLWGEIGYPNPVGWSGHENIGTIVESRCADWKEGDLVLALPEGPHGLAEYIVAQPPGITRLPEEASVKNPVDLIASATPDNYEFALDCVFDDPDVDAAIAAFVPPLGIQTKDVAAAIVRVSERYPDKPLLAVLMGRQGLPAGLAELHEARIPAYIFPESAARALAAMWRDYPERMQWWADMEAKTGGQFHKSRSYAALGDFVDRQADWLFNDEAYLCQKDEGECTS